MTFDEWWDADALTQTNPYREDSPAYWAWEGWQAGVMAERERCAKICDEIGKPDLENSNRNLGEYYREDIAKDCAKAIRQYETINT